MLNRPILLYDGRCGFCRRWVKRLRRLDLQGRIALLPAADRGTVPELPPLSDEALDRAMHLVLPDGTVLSGARAAPAILQRLPGWRALAWVFRVPGVQALADRVYEWIAAHRHRMGCGPDGCGREGD